MNTGAFLFGWMPAGFLAVLGWSLLTVARNASARLSRSGSGSRKRRE